MYSKRKNSSKNFKLTDLRQTILYGKYLEDLGWIVERVDNINYFIKKFSIIGSVLKLQRPEHLDTEMVWLLGKKYRVFQIIVEPKYVDQSFTLIENRFKLGKSIYLPSKTIHVDLTNSMEEILTKMHPKTRYNIKIATRNEVEIEISRDIDTFAKFWDHESFLKGKFIPQSKQIRKIYHAFGNKAGLILAFKDKKLLGGILLITSHKISYYMYAAFSKPGKNFFAPTLLVWEAIKMSKKIGSKIFDFEGIYDERFPNKSWLGFTHFKKSFGGYEISYPGTFVKNLLPFRL